MLHRVLGVAICGWYFVSSVVVLGSLLHMLFWFNVFDSLFVLFRFTCAWVCGGWWFWLRML